MHESALLVEQACRGVRPARTPIFDLLASDAVIAHFGGRPLDGTDDEAIVVRAVGRALDGTRWLGLPGVPGTTWTDAAGSVWVCARWTSWIREPALRTPQDWLGWLRAHLPALEEAPPPEPAEADRAREAQLALNARLGGTTFIHCTPSTAINEALFGYRLGLEAFSYLWADERDILLRWLRALEERQLRYIATAAHSAASGLAMIYSDVAYRGRPMFSPRMFAEMGFYEDVARICAACHARGLKVVFHSDGDVTPLMPDLMAAGIDGLNPLEKAAGVDVYALRRAYPGLLMVGGMDVTHLLPFGTAAEVRVETRRMIREVGSEGLLLIGSSTELEDNVPLANYLAFHDEVMRG